MNDQRFQRAVCGPPSGERDQYPREQNRVTGVWYCPQCGYVDGPCDPMGSEFDHGHLVCDAEFYSDDEELLR